MNASTVLPASQPDLLAPDSAEPLDTLQPTPMATALARAGTLSARQHLDYDGRPLCILAFDRLYPFAGLRFNVH